MEHYFTNKPSSPEDIQSYEAIIADNKFRFLTSGGVFSKKTVDFGSILLIETVIKKSKKDSGELLDVGCGYGPIGIALAKNFSKINITMVDINERAIQLAEKNIQVNGISNAKAMLSNGFENVSGSFDIIVTNPPIRAGKTVVYSFFEGAYEHLKTSGEFYAVIQKKQGANSAIDKLISLFGNCEKISKKAGYYILYSVKRN